MTSGTPAAHDDEERKARRRRKRRAGAAMAAVAVVVESAALARKGYRPGRVVVRCRQGHLFTTTWIPGASLKAARLGWYRFQRCPAGPHWSLVVPVDERHLGAEEREAARAVRDTWLP